MNSAANSQTKVLRGIPVSAGIVIGRAHVVETPRLKMVYQYLLDEKQVEREVERFLEALHSTEQQLANLKESMPEAIRSHGFIIDAHLMILKDSMLCDATVEKIRKEQINAEWALKKSLREIRRLFEKIEDPYIRGRIDDVEDVIDRIIRNLAGDDDPPLGDITQRVIVVAHKLSPTDTSEMDASKVMGFVTDVGGRTSHTAIMAQALKIPAVVGLETITQVVEDGDLLIVDGISGDVIINPQELDIIQYGERQTQYHEKESLIAKSSHAPAITKDGHRVIVRANIEFLEEVASAKENGGEGIGLYRTEFLYLKARGLPTEEELFLDYKDAVERVAPEPVTIRTLDLGGEKFPHFSEPLSETNPALGLRGIRLCLKEPEVFRTQMRAILRASAFGRLQVMFPMVSGLQELLDAKRFLDEVKEELDREGIGYDPNLPVGIMIEVPSAVAMAEVLGRHVDFFSIGTNDLIQYALAIDRVNEHVAYMYQPFHPAILRMIRNVVEAGRQCEIPVSLCGEMASDPLCTGILLGLGISELSINTRAIPVIKELIRALSLEEAKRDLEQVMALSTASEVQEYLMGRMKPILETLGRGESFLELSSTGK